MDYKDLMRPVLAEHVGEIVLAIEKAKGAATFSDWQWLRHHIDTLTEKVCSVIENPSFDLIDSGIVGADMFTFNVTVNHSGFSETQFHQLVAELGQLRGDVKTVIEKENQILATQADIESALQKIDDATTAQGKVLTDQGTTLQTISDEIDALIIAAQNGTITPTQLARLQTLADAQATIATNLAAQGEFSKAIAAKGAANPVPTPVPTPNPTPVP